LTVTGSGSVGECGTLTLSPHKVEKSAAPTVTNSRKAEIPVIRVNMKYRLGNFGRKTVTNNIVSGSSGSVDPMLWALRL